LPDLTRLVNAHIEAIPPCWTLSEAQVAYAIDHAVSLWDVHFADERKPSTKYATWSVIDGGHVIAALQTASMYKDLDPPVMHIVWVAADPARPDALDALLAHSYMRAASAGGSLIHVDLRCPFGVGWFGIPTTWTHIGDALLRNDFHPHEKWVLMSGRADSGVSFPQPEIFHFDLLWQINERALEWNLEANSDFELVGDCFAWGIPPHLADARGFDEWITIEWLDVDDTLQGRGIGRYLLAEQMRFQARRGIKHVIAWTEVDNIAPQRVNLACGMTHGPECWTWESRF
jgi:GNAT superfamily N-acetyltransferase